MQDEPSAAAISGKAFKIILTVTALVVGITQTPLLGVLSSAQANLVASVGTYLQANPVSQSLDDALVGHWTFDGADTDISNTTAEFSDRSGNGNTGDWVNHATTTTVGPVGQAVAFDGVNDYINVGSDTSIDNIFTVDDDTASVAMWLYVDDDDGDITTDGYIINKKTSGGWRVYMNDTNDRLTFHVDTYSQPGIWSVPVPFNEWFQVVITYDSSSTSNDPNFYINGELQSEIKDNTMIGFLFPDSPANLVIGKDANALAGYFKGRIDDVRIYDRLLSLEEVQIIYGASAPAEIQMSIRSTPSLAIDLEGYYTFDNENVDFGDTAAEIKDSSASGFSGDLINHDSTLDPGLLGQALEFDGSNDYINLGDNKFHYANDFTVATWVRIDIDTNDEHGLIHTWGGRWQLRVDTAGDQVKPRMYWHIGGFVGVEGPDLDFGKWHHLAAVKRSSGDNELYVDGVLVDSVTNTGSVTYSGGPTHIGGIAYIGFDNRNYLGGALDEVRIYDRPLTASEIRLLANINNDLKISIAETVSFGLSDNPVAHWTFDGPDMDLSNSLAEVKDKTGNGNTGDWVNHATSTAVGKIGQAVEFDGVDDYVNSGYDPLLTDNEWSISAWFSSESALLRNHTIIGAQSGSIGSEHRIFYDRSLDRLSVRLGDSDSGAGVGLHTTESFFDGEWHHVVVTARHRDRMNLYVNGELKNTADISANSQVTGSINPPVYQIGTFLSNGSRQDYFAGKLDDVRVYERMLSVEEVERLYGVNR